MGRLVVGREYVLDRDLLVQDDGIAVGEEDPLLPFGDGLGHLRVDDFLEYLDLVGG
jgi:hypothetical protein